MITGTVNFITVDTVILGRSTYEHIKILTPNIPYGDKTCCVFGNVRHYHDEHVTLISEDVRHSRPLNTFERGRHRRFHHHCYSRCNRDRHPAVS